MSARVHRLIAAANEARGAKRWDAAADHYFRALTEDDSIYHIWIQFGHALKEGGHYVKSADAYLRAALLSPLASEPHLHLGHLHKITGDTVKAGRSYLYAACLDPKNADAIGELHRQLMVSSGDDRKNIVEFLKAHSASDESEDAYTPSLKSEQALLSKSPSSHHKNKAGTASNGDFQQADAASLKTEDENCPTIVFDVSDLIEFYSNLRLPTGIQRVQIEVIVEEIRSSNSDIRICCFVNGCDDWLEIPTWQFLKIAELSVKSGECNDPEWIREKNRLYLMLAHEIAFDFPQGAYLVNLGSSWWIKNYFLYIRDAKKRRGVKYIPFIHDLIPILMPEHCLEALIEDFISWALGVFDHADGFLVNSEATKRDLLSVAARIGRNIDPADVAVVKLDATFSKEHSEGLDSRALAKWQLDSEPFVLFVATIESRKGHIFALEAWSELIRRNGAGKTPKLICVGNNGWLNDAVYDRLKCDQELSRKVSIVSGLSDQELSLLYRNCLLTIYPSLYEGWGLPVSEALSFGKVVITTSSSSLPEAGREFAIYVEPGSASELAVAVEAVAFDPVFRAGLEQRISDSYRPRTWRDVARQIDDVIGRLADRRVDEVTITIGQANLGLFYPITRSTAKRVWHGIGSGEVFRSGVGWRWPDDDGCWTSPQGGGLAVGLPPGREPLRVYLWLQGLPDTPCPWHIDQYGRPILTGVLAPGERRWVWFDSADVEGGTLCLSLHGHGRQSAQFKLGSIEKPLEISIGLRGFFLCPIKSESVRLQLIEAAALGNVEILSAYREDYAVD